MGTGDILFTSAFTAAVVSGLLNYFSNKKLDIQQRTMDTRKDLYTKICNHLAKFIDTVSDKESDEAMDDLLRYFREVQLWGSDHVVRSFKKLLDFMADKTSSQADRNILYKNFVISMRQDILGDTDLNIEDIDIRGFVKK